MTRRGLEHIIGAVGMMADDDDVVVLGSQAILGQFPSAPSELLMSNEADVYPRTQTNRRRVIDAIGAGSRFEREFGYCARSVGEETAVLPEGWRDRLILVCGENTRHVRGWCLEVHDLAISKYVAGREKDIEFTGALVRHGMVSRNILDARLAATRMDDQIRSKVARRIDAEFTSGTAPRSPS